MKKVAIIVSVLLIVGHLLTEIPSIISRANKEWWQAMQKKVDLFYAYDMEMELFWYFKMSADDFLFSVTFFSMAWVSKRYSFRLFLIFGVFFLYHFFDGLMFWYNYKTSHWLYWTFLAAVILTISFLILPVEKLRSKYKSMQ